MAEKVKPIPEGFHTLTPYLIIKGAAEAIDFYKQAFGAQELFRMNTPDGQTIGHAEIKIGDSAIMLADEAPNMEHRSPQSLNGSPVSFLLYVEDVDAAFDRAVGAGATVKYAVENKFYGDRSGTVADPFGYLWSLSTHVEDVAHEELERRMKTQFCGEETKQQQGTAGA